MQLLLVTLVISMGAHPDPALHQGAPKNWGEMKNWREPLPIPRLLVLFRAFSEWCSQPWRTGVKKGDLIPIPKVLMNVKMRWSPSLISSPGGWCFSEELISRLSPLVMVSRLGAASR